MSGPQPSSLHIHGWKIFIHPLLFTQLEALSRQVEALRKKDPIGYSKKNCTKRLAAIRKLIFDVIPQDPARPEYRQGKTLGSEYKHWFRAKFFQQYRLFFRFHSTAKIIVFAWVNDEDSKRAFGSGDDAYRVFLKMLEGGNPPSEWNELLAEAHAESERLRGLAEDTSS